MVSVDIKWAAGHDFDHRFGRTPAWIGTPKNIIVSNVLNPTLSWALKNAVTDRLLQHEQGHFDLSEVYRRKLEQSLCEVCVTGSNGEAVKAALDRALHAVADPILIQAKAMYQRYDVETSYGRNEAEQARWNQLIETWLGQPLTAP